ncbi:hypothetical protein SAY87_011587 [Trapa incisa]|uniref:Glycosyl transferase CAP10 domain-containing protein n=1 Tax=Trapa incisa TaxID=236973 RepID=A0AAN7GLD0_9MYRT|nr:hypothetical protein SAY87_011587 [Trapa incisa]
MEEEEVQVRSSSSEVSSISSFSAANSQTVASRSSAWTTMRTCSPSTIFISFLLLIVISRVLLSGVSFPSKLPSSTTSATTTTTIAFSSHSHQRTFHQYLLNCTSSPQQCSSSSYYPTASIEPDSDYTTACPHYFRWIHEDLRPWRATGITRDAIESRKSLAHFRLVVHKGKAYLEQFHRAWQTRDVFTLWGILQMLRLYPGRVPDLEMMFCCEDLPALPKRDNRVPEGTAPPAMFHYCGHESAFDIPFPDWSFWGWPEVNIKPWASMLKAIQEKAAKVKWKDRDVHAFWKGNVQTSRKRGNLMRCNPKMFTDWNARLYNVHWDRESSSGFKESRLEDQCVNRYNLYIEGRSWSVSEKYILACDSTTLVIRPEYYDFFIRGMIPMEHYWPINPDNKCRDIKFAVDWGNNHTVEAQTIGEEGARFAWESLSMQRVYEYMFHVLSEYAKLQRFEVTVPPAAVELCAETMGCSAEGQVKEYMMESLVSSPSRVLPCSMPPPYQPHEIEEFLEMKENITKQVGMWEWESWQKLSQKNYMNAFLLMSVSVFVLALLLVPNHTRCSIDR